MQSKLGRPMTTQELHLALRQVDEFLIGLQPKWHPHRLQEMIIIMNDVCMTTAHMVDDEMGYDTSDRYEGNDK
jgi:hypothetical protein